MFQVSGPELVIAACRAGLVGAFPVANARSTEELDAWLVTIAMALKHAPQPCGPWCPNLIMRDPRTPQLLEVLLRHRPELVITSVGSPAPAIPALHDIGCLVFADVATLRHADKALADGADGLILLTAGAGGNTGWLNPFAFVREVRRNFDGPIVLAGGMIDGAAIYAAEVLGCDLAYVGTRLIAARESLASEPYREMLVAASMDDIMTTRAFTGIDSNMLRPSIVAAGLDPATLPFSLDAEEARNAYGFGGSTGLRRWRDIWSAGHSVSGVRQVRTVAQIVEQIAAEYLLAGDRRDHPR